MDLYVRPRPLAAMNPNPLTHRGLNGRGVLTRACIGIQIDQ